LAIVTLPDLISVLDEAEVVDICKEE